MKMRMTYLPGSPLWPSSLCLAKVGREEWWGESGQSNWGLGNPEETRGEGLGVDGSPGFLGFTVLPSLVLVPLHTTPKDVEKELNALYNVFLDVSQRWQSKEVILLGDFNADCTSLPKKRLSQLLLRTEAGFHWVIPDGEDTTVRASTHCTYDRIVLHGEGCQSLLQAAAAFNFPKSFHLTEEEALSISDHYPVEVELNQTARSIQPLSLPTLLLLSLLLSLLPSQLDLVAHGCDVHVAFRT
ncbi:Hypothetical predicted protein [Marmota monax]|uniref:Deoxyribonuclease-1-like 1 n=1 Tax=Marmota monax TaxID=9995 RepID=A0A5E4B235_MARMO|nr:deoxyribonuclease-1 1 [Marmota monax]KAF7462902.1 deoxyribonuclease-1 1 [Marmota monax]KAF7462903.1 deoxyribonuclease-1 1 [Marmota monax]VTJ63146.1 Hypothetical predicted protein [Marmota monax]